MFPTVAEVIEIAQRLCAGVFDNAVAFRASSGPSGQSGSVRPSQHRRRDFIEMAVGPSHRGLQHLMQAVQSDVEWNFDVARNRWFDILKGDLEAGNSIGTR